MGFCLGRLSVVLEGGGRGGGGGFNCKNRSRKSLLDKRMVWKKMIRSVWLRRLKRQLVVKQGGRGEPKCTV